MLIKEVTDCEHLFLNRHLLNSLPKLVNWREDIFKKIVTSNESACFSSRYFCLTQWLFQRAIFQRLRSIESIGSTINRAIETSLDLISPVTSHANDYELLQIFLSNLWLLKLTFSWWTYSIRYRRESLRNLKPWLSCHVSSKTWALWETSCVLLNWEFHWGVKYSSLTLTKFI